MDMLLFLIGFLLLIGSLIYLVVSLIKKNFAKKKFISAIASGLVLMIIGLSIPSSGSSTETASEAQEPTEESTEEPEKEKAAKAEEEALAKEKEEQKKAKEVAAIENNEQEKDNLAKQVEVKPTFDYSWEEFKNSWGTLIPEISNSGIGVIREKDSINQNDNIVINAEITNYLMMMVDIEPNSNKVKYATIMGEPSSDNNAQNANIILAFGNLIANSNPSLNPEERADILMNGLGFNKGDFSNPNEEYEYKGVKYTASNMAGILTLSISPVE